MDNVKIISMAKGKRKSKYDKARDSAYKYYFDNLKYYHLQENYWKKLKLFRNIEKINSDIILPLLDIWEGEKLKWWHVPKLFKGKNIFIQL